MAEDCDRGLRKEKDSVLVQVQAGRYCRWLGHRLELLYTHVYTGGWGPGHTETDRKENPGSNCSAQNIHPTHPSPTHPFPHGRPFPLLLGHKTSHSGRQPHVLSGVYVMSCGPLPVLRSPCLLLSSLWCPPPPQRPPPPPPTPPSLLPLPLLLPPTLPPPPRTPRRACLRLPGGGAHGTSQGKSEGGGGWGRHLGREVCVGKAAGALGEVRSWDPATGRAGISREWASRWDD